MAIWRYTEAAPDLSPYLDPITEKAGSAFDTANRTAAELQKWLAEQNAGASGGKSYAAEFSVAGNLPATLIQDPQNGLRAQDSAARIVWGYDTGRIRTFMAATADELDGDDQSAVVTIAGALDIYNDGTGHPNGIVICADAGRTRGIMAWFYRDRIDLGHYNGFSDGTIYPTIWRSWPNVTIPPSSTLELRRTGYLFKIVVNGTVIAQHQAAPETIPAYTGPLFRRTGFTLHKGWGAIFAVQSAAVGSFSTSDISVPVTKGTGWALSRITTGTVNLRVTSGWALMPAYTYDMTERIAGCEAYGDYQAGGILIKKTDWYTMSIGTRLNSSLSSSAAAAAGLYYAPVAGGALGLLRQASDSLGTNQSYCGGSFCEYLQAGSVIAPAIYVNNTNKVAPGDGAGTRTWFSGFARG